MIRFLTAFLCLCLCSGAGASPIRVIAANLTSGTHQTYSPDNGNHSNPEGAGARILKSLSPDIVLIQEFNTTVPVRQWVNDTLGRDYTIVREEHPGIPNGILTRLPVKDSGEWDDPCLDNRGFVWARVALPDGTTALVVSVHMKARDPAKRSEEARALACYLRGSVRPGERVLIGGDFNSEHTDEGCFRELSEFVRVPEPPPSDQYGNPNTNAPRKKPYDAVLADERTNAASTSVRIGNTELKDGAVFDTRTFSQPPAPAMPGDSGVAGMQHMAVVRDFELGH